MLDKHKRVEACADNAIPYKAICGASATMGKELYESVGYHDEECVCLDFVFSLNKKGNGIVRMQRRSKIPIGRERK